MLRTMIFVSVLAPLAGFASLTVLASLTGLASPAVAQSVDSLKGQFAFNWLTNPDKTRCAPVNDRQIELFKSAAFKCDMAVKTNTASGKPARVCTKKGGGAEYMIFSSKAFCELERKTQVSNGD